MHTIRPVCHSVSVSPNMHTLQACTCMRETHTGLQTARLLKLTLHRWLTEEEALNQHKMHFCDHCTNCALVCDGSVPVRH